MFLFRCCRDLELLDHMTDVLINKTCGLISISIRLIRNSLNHWHESWGRNTFVWGPGALAQRKMQWKMNELIRWLDQLKLNTIGTKAFLHWSRFGCLQEPMIRQELYCWKQICSEKGARIKPDHWLVLLYGLSQVESNAEGSLHMMFSKHF